MLDLRQRRPLNILLVEDNPGDVRLIREVLREMEIERSLHVVNDGVQALAYLHREGPYANTTTPDIVLLDLNLPRKHGREVLRTIKDDPDLRMIPVAILTSSTAQDDVCESYARQASCYLVKPMQVNEYFSLMELIRDFWGASAMKLPTTAGCWKELGPSDRGSASS